MAYPSADLDWYDRRFFVRANGHDFEVFEAGASDSRKLALCLHGFPEHAVSWRHQLPLLARLGYRVWAPNQRGYGRSFRPPRIADYRMDELLADVAGLIDASDAQEVILLAHDWGAALAWAFAIEQVRPIDRLVIMNVPHPAPFAAALRRGWRQRLKSWYIAFFQIPFLPEWLLRRDHARAVAAAFQGADGQSYPDWVIETYRRNADEPYGLTAMINWYRAAVRHGSPWGDGPIARIEVPTLMLWGEADVALDKSTTYGTEAYVDDFTLRYLPGVSHWVQQEAPGTVNAMLAAWLAGEPVPEATDLAETR